MSYTFLLHAPEPHSVRIWWFDIMSNSIYDPYSKHLLIISNYSTRYHPHVDNRFVKELHQAYHN